MDHLTDAPIANILILAGIIFLAVGLFGRIGGFIGSIFGNIEAGRNSRVLAGALGALLITGGAWLHESGDQKAASNSPATTSAATTSPTVAVAQPAPAPGGSSATTPAAPAANPSANPVAPPVLPGAANQLAGSAFVGQWTNQTPGPDRLHRFQIDPVGQQFTIHLWAACSPADCDNGAYSLDVAGQTATYSINTGKKSRVGKMTLEAPGRLHVIIDHTSLDSHATKQFDWIFVKTN